MNNIPDDILYKIFDKIKIKTRIKYLSYGDGEQHYSIFYKELYPYNIVCNSWKKYFKF
tara:strand:- start:141 stop:314 length:174 start_codon:yes stop_codon:yes gene_type:complete